MKRVSLIIPCYNEQDVLPVFYQTINKVLDQTKYRYEFLFVDDGSRDNTLTLLKEMAKENSATKYISFSRNFGKEAAMYAGLRYADGDYVAILDADLQDPPSLLPKMLDIIEQGEYDSVATRRRFRKGEPPIRSCFAKIFYKIIGWLGKLDIRDGARDFRLMKQNMVKELVQMGEHDRFIKAMFCWVGFKTYWLEFDNVIRPIGTSKWSFFKLLKYSLSAIFNYSNIAINIIFVLAAFTSLITFCGVMVVLFSGYKEVEIYNFELMMCLISFIGTALLWSVWLVSIFASKIYTEVQNRPHYIIAQTNKEIK